MRHLRGFTLLEVLVALAIFALIGSIAYRMLNAVTETQAGLSAHIEQRLMAQRILWLISEDLRWVVARPIRAGAFKRPAVEGNVQTPLALSRGGRGLIPLSSSTGPLFRVGYRWSDPNGAHPDRDAGTLYRDVWTVLDRPQEAKPISQQLAAGIDRFSVRFLGTNGRWSEQWPPVSDSAIDPTTLPEAIEVSIDGGPFNDVRRLVTLP